MKSLFSLLFIFLTFVSQPALAQEKQSIFDVSNTSLFSNDDEFLKVDQAFNFNFYQNNNQLEISFIIEPGYYLYRHQFKFKGHNAHYSEVQLPKGIDHEDEFFGVQQIFTEQLTFNINLEQVSENATIRITYQGCAEKGLCYAPKTQEVKLTVLADKAQPLNELHSGGEDIATSIIEESEQHQLADMLKQDSLLLTLVAFFVGGLLLSFTPCVFPMYPILTGIIVGQGNKDKPLSTKKAFTLSFIYVQGMAVTYTLLGVVVALAGAKFQAVFQSPIVLITLSVVFVVLALSMFGAFNLALPASWQNKLNNMSNQQKGGSIFGVLIMGVISGLVASPCTTAPLTGALLYISQTGDVVLGASALYALSLGMGLPLLVLGSSGGKLLPKAGAWMNVIKNIFGLLLLAVPVFLLERLIPTMMSDALWALLILASASYFYVVNQQNSIDKTSSKTTSFWYGFRSLIIFLMLFFGANLAYKLIFPTEQVTAHNTAHAQFKQVSTLTELESQVLEANAQGKTVMVDLYADWCIACKEFEKYTFSDSQVQKALANTIWLQVDMTDFDSKDNEELAHSYQVLGLPSILFFNEQGKELTKQRTTGFMNATDFVVHVNKTFSN